MKKTDETWQDWHLAPKDYTVMGDGFPIRITGSGVVGVIDVSGWGTI